MTEQMPMTNNIDNKKKPLPDIVFFDEHEMVTGDFVDAEKNKNTQEKKEELPVFQFSENEMTTGVLDAVSPAVTTESTAFPDSVQPIAGRNTRDGSVVNQPGSQVGNAPQAPAFASRDELEKTIKRGLVANADPEKGKEFAERAMTSIDILAASDNLNMTPAELSAILYAPHIRSYIQQLGELRKLLRENIFARYDNHQNNSNLKERVEELVSLMMYMDTLSLDLDACKPGESFPGTPVASGPVNPVVAPVAPVVYTAAPSTPAAPGPRIDTNLVLQLEQAPQFVAPDSIAGKAVTAMKRIREVLDNPAATPEARAAAHAEMVGMQRENIFTTETTVQSLDRRLRNAENYNQMLLLAEQEGNIAYVYKSLKKENPEYGAKVTQAIAGTVSLLVANGYSDTQALQMILRGGKPVDTTGQPLVGPDGEPVVCVGLIPSNESKLRRLSNQKERAQEKIIAQNSSINESDAQRVETMQNLVRLTAEQTASQGFLRRKLVNPILEKWFAVSKTQAATSNALFSANPELQKLTAEYEKGMGDIAAVRIAAARSALERQEKSLSPAEVTRRAAAGITIDTLMERYIAMITKARTATSIENLQNEVINRVSHVRATDSGNAMTRTIARATNAWQSWDSPIKRGMELAMLSVGTRAAVGGVKKALGFGTKILDIPRILLGGSVGMVAREIADRIDKDARRDMAALNNQRFEDNSLLSRIPKVYSWFTNYRTWREKSKLSEREKAFAEKGINITPDLNYFERAKALGEYLEKNKGAISIELESMKQVHSRYTKLAITAEREAIMNAPTTSYEKQKAFAARIKTLTQQIENEKSQPQPNAGTIASLGNLLAGLKKAEQSVSLSRVGKMQKEYEEAGKPEDVLKLRKELEAIARRQRITQSAMRWLSLGVMTSVHSVMSGQEVQHPVNTGNIQNLGNGNDAIEVVNPGAGTTPIENDSDTRMTHDRVFAGREVPIPHSNDIGNGMAQVFDLQETPGDTGGNITFEIEDSANTGTGTLVGIETNTDTSGGTSGTVPFSPGPQNAQVMGVVPEVIPKKPVPIQTGPFFPTAQPGPMPTGGTVIPGRTPLMNTNGHVVITTSGTGASLNASVGFNQTGTLHAGNLTVQRVVNGGFGVNINHNTTAVAFANQIPNTGMYGYAPGGYVPVNSGYVQANQGYVRANGGFGAEYIPNRYNGTNGSATTTNLSAGFGFGLSANQTTVRVRGH